MAKLKVNTRTIAGAGQFLDSVQNEGGDRYGYTSPGSGKATTAIGLLSRMYVGWKRNHPALQRGAFLGNVGPSETIMYYNYYATQVIKQFHGEDAEEWRKWNVKMRDWLVKMQSRKGHQEGSGYIAGGHANQGGRLYSTSMATMILEVYYRHTPIYDK